MKLVLKLKLDTDRSSDQAFLDTRKRYAACCNDLSRWVFEQRNWHRFSVHRERYYPLKSQYGLPAQLVVRAIAEVCSAYQSQTALLLKHNKSCPLEERRELVRIAFKDDVAIPYDERVFSYGKDDTLSLTVLGGRICVGFHAGERRRHLLASRKGQADLKRLGKVWYLLQTIEIPEAPSISPENHIGVDCGICTVASAHDGSKTKKWSGARIRARRHHYHQLRRGLQRHNTRSSRRRVRLLRNKESRVSRNYNHLISRRIVQMAQRTRSWIVLEDLEGIHEGQRVSKEQRRERLSWSFNQLQQFILYKAKLAGVPVMFVPADYTSKTCSRCHWMSDANRRVQAIFRCTRKECRCLCHADENAAINIRFLGGASTAQKRVVCMQEYLQTDRRKPLASAMG